MKKMYLVFILICTVSLFSLLMLPNLDLNLLAFIKEYHRDLQSFVAMHYLAAVALYVMVYLGIVMLPIPGDTAMPIVGGCLFGFQVGLVLATLSFTVGNVLVFLFFRYLVNHHEKLRLLTLYGKAWTLKSPYLLLGCRMVPIFPSFILNIVASCMPISWGVFVLTTVLGGLPLLTLYSFAGNELTVISSFGDLHVASMMVIASALVVMVALPLGIKYLQKFVRTL